MGTGEEDGVVTTKNTDAKVTKELTMRDPLVVTLLLVGGVSGHARQAPETARPPAAFEVASVKRSAPDARGMRVSGPALSGFRTLNAPLSNIIHYAFNIADYQLIGGPAWVRSDKFDIVAKYPEGNDRARVPEMVQTRC